MKKEVNILIAESNKEHFDLVRTNLQEAGVHNEILHFADGQQLLDFLFNPDTGPENQCRPQESMVLTELNLLNVDGLQILERIKQDEQLKKMPVIILTTTDDQDTIDRCFSLKCSSYIIKPAESQEFEETIQSFARFLSVVETLI
ncbi:MAG: response regulator [Planctomycetota bacterium]|jgi:CheY-like chemotaxis protein